MERLISSRMFTVVSPIRWHGTPTPVSGAALWRFSALNLQLGCNLTTPGNFSGVAGSTTCDATINYNTGCGIVDQSIASFGPTFNAKGGGIYAMKWDEISIDVCESGS
jgi:hypothetical protein